MSLWVSTAYVEKVVYPPSNPTPTNGRTSRCGRRASTMDTISTPINTQPDTLTTNVPTGNPRADPGSASETSCRARAPTAPPTAITATTSHRRGRLSIRVRRPSAPATVDVLIRVIDTCSLPRLAGTVGDGQGVAVVGGPHRLHKQTTHLTLGSLGGGAGDLVRDE